MICNVTIGYYLYQKYVKSTEEQLLSIGPTRNLIFKYVNSIIFTTVDHYELCELVSTPILEYLLFHIFYGFNH